MIEVKSLSFGYVDSLIINNLDLSINQGEFVGVIGPNGAGKSTLLRLLAGILRPRVGTIDILRREINSYKREELARIVGFIPQETHFSLDFKVCDVVMQGRFPHLGFFKIEDYEDRRIMQEAIARTQIEDLADKGVLEISSGERQLVVITRAIAQQPEILLLDEPTSFLDIRHQIEIMGLLRKLNHEGTTIMIVVHDLNLASLFCSRLLLINKGIIIASGPPDSIITREMIENVYGVKVVGIRHPTKDLPQILLD